jgi:hypothetical protein
MCQPEDPPSVVMTEEIPKPPLGSRRAGSASGRQRPWPATPGPRPDGAAALSRPLTARATRAGHRARSRARAGHGAAGSEHRSGAPGEREGAGAATARCGLFTPHHACASVSHDESFESWAAGWRALNPVPPVHAQFELRSVREGPPHRPGPAHAPRRTGRVHHLARADRDASDAELLAKTAESDSGSRTASRRRDLYAEVGPRAKHGSGVRAAAPTSS